MSKLLQIRLALGVGLVLLLLASASELIAATTWDGSESADWNDPNNWSAGVPDAGDDVTIPSVCGACFDPILDASASTKKVTIQSGGSLTINSGGSLTAVGDVKPEAGSTLTVTGGSLTINNKNLDVKGTLTFSDGTISCKDFTGGGTTSMSGGTLKVSHDFKPSTPSEFSASGGTVEFTGNPGGATFKPAGTYQFFNIQINSGVNPNFGNASNTFEIKGTLTNNSTTATFAGTTVDFNGAIAQSIVGSEAIDFETLNITNTSATVSADQNFSVATAATVSSGANLDMGTNTMSGAGTFTLDSGGTLGIGSSAGITSSGATGNIQVTGTRSYSTGANYTYNASGNQVMGSGLPGTVNNLSLSGSGTKTLGSSRTISGNLSISGTAVAELGSITTHTANTLTLGGTGQVNGTWGSSSASPSADHPNDTYFSGTGLVTVSLTILPIELIRFYGYADAGLVHLSWSTASELNNEKFLIERSTDGKTFKFIGEVRGSGTTIKQQDYLFTDVNPLHGINYYRLRQIDYDGNFEYSPVIIVRIAVNRPVFNAYPIPAKEVLYLDVIASDNNVSAGDMTVYLYNISGELMKQVDSSMENQTINIQDFPSGIYIVEVQYAGEKFTQLISVE